MKAWLVCIIASTLFSFKLYAQSEHIKLIGIDSVGLNTEIKDLLRENLSHIGIQYHEYLDFGQRCSYKFVEFTKEDEMLSIRISDCNDELLGNELIHRHIWLANDEDIAAEITKSIAGILNTELVEAIKETGKKSSLSKFKNHHDSRYFFAPSAYNLRKGQLYYNTNYFLVHDLQYGVSDNFSIGMGTSVAAIPFYVTPKLSIPLSGMHSLAVGDLFIVGTYGPSWNINLAYGAYTYGTDLNNMTIGIGAIHSSELVGTNPVLNFSTMLSLSKYTYFISENYFAPELLNNGYQVFEYGMDNFGNYSERLVKSENFKQSVAAGFLGLRLINKKKDVSSWQFGMLYLIPFGNDRIPSEYQGNPAFDYDVDPTVSLPNFLVIPNVSYTLKFGRKY